MVSVRKRELKTQTSWIVDYRDPKGRRRYLTCPNEKIALQVAKELDADSFSERRRQHYTTVGDLWETLCAKIEGTTSPVTQRIYRSMWQTHLDGPFAHRALQALKRSELEIFISRKFKEGYKPKTVLYIASVLRQILRVGVRDGVIPANLIDGLTADLGLWRLARGDEPVKAFTAHELDRFLLSARELYPFLYPMFFTMARTGLRINEAIGLQWECVDLDGTMHEGERIYQMHVRQSLIREAYRAPYLDRTKNRRTRRVDISDGLRELLTRHRAAQQATLLLRGSHLTSEDWVFPHPDGGPLNSRTIPRQFKRILEKAGLSIRFHPHCLRHTFASQHLKIGTPITYLKEQLGHSKIQLTINTYGHWLSKTNMAAANRLDDAFG